jgi:hypothetical protein
MLARSTQGGILSLPLFPYGRLVQDCAAPQ